MIIIVLAIIFTLLQILSILVMNKFINSEYRNKNHFKRMNMVILLLLPLILISAFLVKSSVTYFDFNSWTNLVIALPLIIAILLGCVMYNANEDGNLLNSLKFLLNSVLWPVTIVMWTIFKFLVVTPFLIIKNRILFPLYNLTSWFYYLVAKESKRKKSLVNNLDSKALYKNSELDSTINRIQTINYVKDAITLHLETSNKISNANDSLASLSESSIFIPYKYRNNINLHSYSKQIEFEENDVEFENSESKERSKSLQSIKTKRDLFNTIGVYSRIKTFSDSILINLFYISMAILCVISFVLLSLHNIESNTKSISIVISLTTILFLLEINFNSKIRIKTTKENIKKFNEKISETIISLEYLEDIINGVISRNKETIEENVEEFKNIYWHFVTKFGSSSNNLNFHSMKLSSVYSAKRFRDDEIKEQALFPYDFNKVKCIYPEIQKIEYKKACLEIFENINLKNDFDKRDAKVLSKKFDASYGKVLDLISSEIDLNDNEDLLHEKIALKNWLIDNPKFYLNEPSEISEMKNINLKLVNEALKEISYENKFLRKFNQMIKKEYPKLISDPLILRQDIDNTNKNIISKLYGLSLNSIDTLLLSLSTDREFIREQESSISSLRNELEYFCQMKRENRTIFKNFKFMKKFTNSLDSDLKYVKEKLEEENGNEYFNSFINMNEEVEFVKLKESIKYFNNLKLRNEELMKGVK